MSYLLSRLCLGATSKVGPFSKVSIRGFTSLQIPKGAIVPAVTGFNNSRHPSKLSIQPSRMSSSGDHVALWTAEKIFSGVLIPVIPLALMFPSAGLDYLMAFTITIHSHWLLLTFYINLGIEAIVVDYVRESIFGTVIPKVAVALVYALSAFTLGGLFYFTYSDVGLANAIRMLWKL